MLNTIYTLPSPPSINESFIASITTILQQQAIPISTAGYSFDFDDDETTHSTTTK